MIDTPYAVIFDMDGVLVDSADAHFVSWQRMAAEHGLDVTRDQFDATFGRHNSDIIPLVFGVTAADRVAAMADRKEEIYRELVCADPPIVVGAVELVRDLHRAGAKLAVGSSAPRANVDLVLKLMDVEDIVPVRITGSDVTRGKPDPQVFTIAIDRLAVPPERCVVIEDAPAGVAAARAGGARAVAILVYQPLEAFDQPDLAVPNLRSLSVAQLRRLAET